MLFAASILTIALAYLGGRHFGLPGIVLGMIIGTWSCLSGHAVSAEGYHACFSFKFFATEMVPYIGSLVILATIPWLARLSFPYSWDGG